MASYLGIGIFLLFSLGLTLFMRLEWGSAAPRVSEASKQWRRDGSVAEDGSYVEIRIVEIEGGLFRRHGLCEQRRRRSQGGDILEVLPERKFTAQ